MEQDRYALTYRAAQARQVMDWIKAGQSGCIIGLRGAGKSNFLRFLLHQDVQRHYLGQDYANFIFALVDLLALAERAEWAVYELMLNRLIDQLRPLGIEGEAVEELASLYQEVTHTRDPLAAQRALERCVDLFCRRPARRIALLFDEFDAVFRTLDPSLFSTLRTIRDAHKGQVSYVVVVTDDLAHLREDLTEVDHFYRLVGRNVCGLGPYGEMDARRMIDYLASQRSIKLSEEDMRCLIELSGGHAGLLKAILSQLWDAPQKGELLEIAPALTEEPTVQAECRKVWASLPGGEQATLGTLVAEALADPHALRRLKRKGLVRVGQPQPLIFSSLFTDFVRQQALPARRGVVISRSPRQVQIEERCVEILTELEFEMLCYLYEHRGRVCTKDELIQNVYGQQYDRMTGGISDATLQTLVARLRAKIEPDRDRPRYIVTLRGEGYKFVEPDEDPAQ
jgi:DNA-binding winged helix-turn-helix (wHTH) protein